ncbi:MAG: aldehyde dehydrogenase [Bacillales bacterium]|nr:aldehyde dehydrogenase [Bacillales bacterium]
MKEKTYDDFVKKLKQDLEKQKAFFIAQKTLPISFRKQQLKNLQAAIQKYESQIFAALQKDLGKANFEAYTTEVGYIYNRIRYALKHMDHWIKPKRVRTPFFVQPAKSQILPSPFGQVLIIAPYNYPFQLLMEPLIGAIVAGNCVVVKPSELTSQTEKIIATIIEEAFAPEYVFSVLGAVEEIKVLLKQRFDYIFFTGSAWVGRKVMEAAAQHLTPVTLELGGKSPVFVDETANLQLAAKRIIWGKMMNAGQTCVAPDYIYAEQSIYHALLQELQKAIQTLYGKEMKNNADYGRIVNAHHFHRLKKLIPQSADVLYFGGEMDEGDRYISPTLLMLDSWDYPVMQEEIFGPILPVLSYVDITQALEVVQKQEKPLALYIFSSNQKKIEQIMQWIPSGGVCVNDTISHLLNPKLPFGGIGLSGMGMYHGKYSFDTFSHQRSVLYRSNRIQVDEAYPPYTKKKFAWIRKIFK